MKLGCDRRVEKEKDMFITTRWKRGKNERKGRMDRTAEYLICIDTGIGGGKVGREKGAEDHLL